jgi:hypothetical protein
MANILHGVGIADARGSVGGAVFSRGKGGAILRNRTKPVNPRSVMQNQRRAHLAYLATAWSRDLTADQRADWEAYAQGTAWTNKLGQSIAINGNAAFVRLNTLRLMAGQARRDEAPTAMGHAGGMTATFAADVTTQNMVITAIDAACDILVATNTVFVFGAPPVEAGRMMVPTGYRILGEFVGVNPTPLPKSIAYPWTFVAGQRINLKFLFIDTDYRISPDLFQAVVAAPI